MKAAILTEIFVFLVLHELVSSDCDFGEYFCRSSYKCIDSDYVCDGDNDCGDLQDETGCNTTPALPVIVSSAQCSGGRFHCPYEDRCINPTWVCDGDEDCLDGVDERSCSGGGPTTSGSILRPSSPEMTTQTVSDCDNEENCKMPCTMNPLFGCYCKSGYYLEVDAKNLNLTDMCVPRTFNPTLVFLLASDGFKSEMMGMDLVTNVAWRYKIRSNHSIMRDVDYDPSSDTLFWNDVGQDSIYILNLKNNSIQLLMEFPSVETPIHIQWDWIAKNFYFIAHRKIKTCDHTLQRCYTLNTHEDNLIWDFVIAPMKKYIFWNFLLDTSGTVHRMDMDGNNETEILSLGRTWHCITVDHQNERFYWANQDGKKVGSSDFNGRNRIGYTMQRSFSLLSEIEVFGDYLYFAHESQKHVERCSIREGSCINILKMERSRTRIQTIKIIHRSLRPDGVNHCLNSGCQELCLPNQEGFTCQCSDTASRACEVKTVKLDFLERRGEFRGAFNQSVHFGGKSSADLSWLKWMGCTLLVLGVIVVVALTLYFYYKRRSVLSTSRLGTDDRQVAAYSHMKSNSECRVSISNLVTL